MLSSFVPVWQTFVSNFAGRILENHQREQKERYETQVEGLKLKVDHLQNENSKLQNLFQEKSNVNEIIRQEVSRLSSENSVCYGLPSFHISLLEADEMCEEHTVICAFHYLMWSTGYTGAETAGFRAAETKTRIGGPCRRAEQRTSR